MVDNTQRNIVIVLVLALVVIGTIFVVSMGNTFFSPALEVDSGELTLVEMCDNPRKVVGSYDVDRRNRREIVSGIYDWCDDNMQASGGEGGGGGGGGDSGGPTACDADLDGNGVVGAGDLAILLGSWGPCADPDDCPADFDGDGIVRSSDLAFLLGNWGADCSGECVSETQITTNVLNQWDPSIYDNIIVWVDFRNGSGDIYMYDLTTGTETQITTSVSIQEEPAIYNNKIVWMDTRNGNWDIYMYDLTTGTETQITTDASTQSLPDIYNNKIVWSDFRNGNGDIYMYDLTTGTETQITTDASGQWDPSIYNNKIVWSDFRNGNGDIYMYDLTTGTETQITTDASGQVEPVIHNNRIVWRDGINGNWDIYMYDISTGIETPITTDTSTQQHLDIHNNKIVWSDNRNGNWDIYMYDLTTGTETQITTEASTQTTPAIYNNKIVWSDLRNGNSDIYMYDLSGCNECTPPPEGMVSWWPGDSNVEDIQDDNTPNDNDVVNVAFEKGKVGEAMSFYENNSHIYVFESYNLDVHSVTMDAWLFPREPYVAFAVLTNGIYEMNYGDENNELDRNVSCEFPLLGGERAKVVHFIPTNVWTHVACTYNKDTGIGKLYLNGGLVATDEKDPAPILDGGGIFAIGGDVLGTTFNGLIDELEIYDRELLQEEIQAIVNADDKGKCKDSWRVFVSSETMPGDIGGLNDADNKCQTLANTASLGGEWKAWLSDSQESASDRLHHSEIPYRRLDGVKVADDWNDLTDGELDNPIGVDEFGNEVPFSGDFLDAAVWTGTDDIGGSVDLFSCDGWTSNENDIIGQEGVFSHADNLWTNWASNGCDTNARLYCFEQPFSGECVEDADCDDASICTQDSCIGGICVYEQADPLPPECGGGGCVDDLDCDDANACTSDTCLGGICVYESPVPLPPECGGCVDDLDCNDFIGCTDDSCNVDGICEFVPQDNLCPIDGEVCDEGFDCVACTPPPEGMVSWWRGDGNADDLQNGNNGVGVNGVSYVDGKVDQAFSFDGVDDYVVVEDADNLDVTSVTIDAWINPQYQDFPPAGDIFVIMSRVELSYTLSIGYTGGPGLLLVCVIRTDTDDSNAGNVGSAEFLVPLDSWSHVACTYDQGTGAVNVYVNGNLGGSGIIPGNGAIRNIDGGLDIGGLAANEASRFDGYIDEVELFDRALSQSEIESIYLAGVAGKCKIPICGNGIVEPGEECEPEGFGGACPVCTAQCVYDFDCCVGGDCCAFGGDCCGDGICDPETECETCKADCTEGDPPHPVQECIEP